MSLYHIKTVSSFVINSIVDADNEEEAILAVSTGDYEFSQKHLGESVISTQVISDDEYLNLFRKETGNWSWPDAFVLAKVDKA